MTENERLVISSRLADYQREDMASQRAKLVELWRQYHPEAANEPPSSFHKLDFYHKRTPDESPDAPDEIWMSDIYTVTLRRRPDKVFNTRQGMILLGINAVDGSARHDWRDFQAIKNQLAGEECEAFELYPAESRLMDPSNYYTLWCFPGLKRIKVGIDEPRRVYDADEALTPQRGFAK
ncbi:MAG: hypothetical protein WBY44_00425 [Bryobacteraceae bacterium]